MTQSTWKTVAIVVRNAIAYSFTSNTAREFTIISYAETPERASRCADVIAYAVLEHGGIREG